MNIAIYAGSFDPFTNGHLEIVIQASNLFDKVIIIIAENEKKERRLNANEMRLAIIKAVKENNPCLTNCFVIVEKNQLVARIAEEYNANYLVRGLRDVNDYLYEDNLASMNLEINPNIKMIYFRSNNAVISSSFVWTLLKHNEQICKYVPLAVLDLIKEKENV